MIDNKSIKKSEMFETVSILPKQVRRKGEGGIRTQGHLKNSLQGKPLITVITVVFNGGNVLEETILSVINQNYDNLEYIIIDGCSSDTTLDIIHRYEHAIDYWVSEEDKGIYDAMNKGIIASRGKFLNFMNAGDCYFDNNILNNLPINSSAKVIFGNIKYKSDKIFESTFNWKMYFKNTLHHQATFYSIDLFKKLGLFDINYKVLADYDFNLKVLDLHIKSENVFLYIAVCSDYGVSDIPNLINYHEEVKIRFKNSCFIGLLLSGYSYSRYFIKKFVRLLS